MNYEWIGKTIKKNIRSKNGKKTVKIKVKLPHVNKKPLAREKANFCSNTILSLYFILRAKKFHTAKSLAFSLHRLFRRVQNHYICDFKTHKNV